MKKNVLETIVKYLESTQNCILTSKCRRQKESTLRFIYFQIARTNTLYSFHDIAKVVNRNHASAVYGIKVFEDQLSQDKKCNAIYQDALNDLSKELTIKNEKKKIEKVDQLNKKIEKLKMENLLLKKEIERNHKSDITKMIPESLIPEFIETRVRPYLLMNKLIKTL